MNRHRIFTCRVFKVFLCISIMLLQISPFTTISVAAAQKTNLNIIAANCNVVVKLSATGKYKYEYDTSKFVVTKAKDDLTMNLIVERKKGASIELMDQVLIYIPKQSYGKIRAISNKAGLSLPKLNTNYAIINNSGAVRVGVPKGFSKTITYIGTKGSGGINMKGITSGFRVQIKADTSAIALPKEFPAYNSGNNNYTYQYKKGTAKFIIQLNNCSFAINK